MTFIKSTRCDTASCVEVSLRRPVIAMRDSKNGETLEFSDTSWREFVAGVQRGEFDRNE